MPNPENIKGQGFHTNPERINKEGPLKGKRITTILNELLASEVPDNLLPKQIKEIVGDRKITHQEAIAIIQIMGAYGTISAQRIRMIEMILDRTEGKTHQSIDLTSGGKEIKQNVIKLADGTEIII